MKRTVLEFSIRSRSEAPLSDARERVAAALGCTFRPGRFRGLDVEVADLLGMYVALYEWRDGAGRVLRLQTDVEDPRLYEGVDEFAGQDIADAVIDLLQARGAGRWYRPTAEDVAGEVAYGEEYDARFRVSPEQAERWSAGE